MHRRKQLHPSIYPFYQPNSNNHWRNTPEYVERSWLLSVKRPGKLWSHIFIFLVINTTPSSLIRFLSTVHCLQPSVIPATSSHRNMWPSKRVQKRITRHQPPLNQYQETTALKNLCSPVEGLISQWSQFITFVPQLEKSNCIFCQMIP